MQGSDADVLITPPFWPAYVTKEMLGEAENLKFILTAGVGSNHPWRTMPNHAMTPHVSGTTLEAQKCYAAGVRDGLTNFIQDQPISDDYVKVSDGEIQSGSYKAING